MRSTILNLRAFGLHNCKIRKQYQNFAKRYCTDKTEYTLEKKKIIHPYRKLHPWKSLEKFSQYLVDNIIYNKDGLVAINKPYGISARTPTFAKDTFKTYSMVPNAVNYTLSDAIPFISKELGYPMLDIVKTPEKFMSGVTLLAANDAIKNAVTRSYIKSIGMNLLNKVYWVVTIRVPNQIEGNEHLCLRKTLDPSRTESKIIISDKWGENEKKRRIIKVLNIKYNMISNSTNNLSSLLEIRASTIKWHALRLFASTRLYAPILGDNIYANRIHKIGGEWLLTNPFVKVNPLPEIDAQLLELLHLSKEKQELIPCHIHVRQIHLPDFWGKESLFLEAPLIPPLDWTCKQLNFKNIPEFEEKEKIEISSKS